MAKLSRKQSVGVSFLLHQMVLTDDPQQREDLLKDILESLGIDAKQAAESKESAARYLRHMANKKRKSERPAKQTDNPIDNMPLDELRALNAELRANRDRLFAELQPATKPDPAPTVEEAAQYDVTAKQRRRLAAFDDMSDDDQIDVLRSLWGAS